MFINFSISKSTPQKETAEEDIQAQMPHQTPNHAKKSSFFENLFKRHKEPEIDQSGGTRHKSVDVILVG